MQTVHTWTLSVWLGGMEFLYPIENRTESGLIEAATGAEKICEELKFNVNVELWHEAVIEDTDTGKEVGKIKHSKVGGTEGYNGFVCFPKTPFRAAWEKYTDDRENAEVSE